MQFSQDIHFVIEIIKQFCLLLVAQLLAISHFLIKCHTAGMPRLLKCLCYFTHILKTLPPPNEWLAFALIF